MIYKSNIKPGNTACFNTVFEQAPIGIIVADFEGNITFINTVALDTFGYTKTELTGKKVSLVLDPQFCEEYIVQTGSNLTPAINDQATVRSKDGNLLPAKVHLQYLADSTSMAIYLMPNDSNQMKHTHINKISHQRCTAIETLRRLSSGEINFEPLLSSFQKTILDTVGVMVIVTDENGKIRLFNQEAERNIGYNPTELYNSNTPVLFHTRKDIQRKRDELYELFGVRVTNSFDVLVEKARRGMHEKEQYDYRMKNGQTFPVSLIVTAVRDFTSKIIGFVSVAIDVSERVQAENKLKETKELFLQMLNNFPEGAISIVDRNFRFVYTGDELHRTLQADAKRLIGNEIYPRFPSPVRKQVLSILKDVFKKGISVSDLQLPGLIENRMYMMDVFPLIEKDGTINHAGIIIRNVTKLKMAEDNLREALAKERGLSELKSRFVSMASHEFRTPLSTILSSAYLIERYNTSEGQQKRERHLKRIESSVGMLTDVLNELLDIGKIEDGKTRVNNAVYNIEEMLGAFVSEVKDTFKGHQIHFRHEGSSFYCLDVSLMRHIMLNLISNASKFSPDGSVIQVTTFNGGTFFHLSVKDNGIGISDGDQKHITDRFFRGTNVANIQGTGLGLYIVSRYIEMMGGSMECKSELGKGTEFILKFNTKTKGPEENTAD